MDLLQEGRANGSDALPIERANRRGAAFEEGTMTIKTKMEMEMTTSIIRGHVNRVEPQSIVSAGCELLALHIDLLIQFAPLKARGLSTELWDPAAMLLLGLPDDSALLLVCVFAFLTACPLVCDII